jgi:glutamate 5-kinase
VRTVLGDFEAGSPVAVQAADGVIIARGLSGYASQELRSVAGKQMSQAAEIVPNRNGVAVIHCDQMVLF